MRIHAISSNHVIEQFCILFSRINHKGEFYYDKRLNVDVEKVKAPESDVMKITVRYKF